ncbi:DNA mismatch repair protein MutL [Pectinatus cerevisiiphilus]|uniref:DNA mismatch repair protein MutL n=3 Tax=Pectinatus cerevisiiphilus TaxID=86956 RepID=A0A4R3K8S9_9FIRM|nr:DNA mismatch repair protein MutL [Pectinatus cerevisiiphilus]
MISRAIDNAYHSLLPKSGYPLAVLNIEIAKNTIDINVHPQKIEIKFADESRLFKAVYKTILDAVRPAGNSDHNLDSFAAPAGFIKPRYEKTMLQQSLHTPPAYDNAAPSANFIRESYSKSLSNTGNTFNPNANEDAFKIAREKVYALKNTSTLSQNMQNEDILNELEQPAQLPAAGDLLPLGQIDLCYIIAQGEDGMYIIDQHAAHERILYDRFGLAKDRVVSQQLLVHVLLNISPAEYNLLEANKAALYKLGFNVEASGPEQFRLTEIPADIPMDDAENTIRSILASLGSLHTPTPQEIRHACLATAACRAAIKAGDKLTVQQMKIILDELSRTRLPYTCPHGRPTIIRFEHRDLAKMFKRIQ